jgi:hypothetical protein
LLGPAPFLTAHRVFEGHFLHVKFFEHFTDLRGIVQGRKINVLPVFGDHFNTLTDAHGKEFLISDIAGFYILPIVIAKFLT